MSKQLERWQIAIIFLCTGLIIGGIIGLFSVRGLRDVKLGEGEFLSLEEYLENEAADNQTPPPEAISEAEVRTIALETLPDKGEPVEVEYEDGEWEAAYADGTEIKLDAMTGEVLEIEVD